MSMVTEQPTLDEIRVVDCDAHFTEPPDLWSSRAPASMLERMPQMRTSGGITSWYVDDRVLSSVGGNTFQRDAGKQLGCLTVQPWDMVDAACYEVGARLAVLDEMGIESQILFPNAIGFSSNTCSPSTTSTSARWCSEIYNDFLVDVQHDSGGRLFPQAVLPSGTWISDGARDGPPAARGHHGVHAQRQATHRRTARVGQRVLRTDVGTGSTRWARS